MTRFDHDFHNVIELDLIDAEELLNRRASRIYEEARGVSHLPGNNTQRGEIDHG